MREFTVLHCPFFHCTVVNFTEEIIIRFFCFSECFQESSKQKHTFFTSPFYFSTTPSIPVQASMAGESPFPSKYEAKLLAAPSCCPNEREKRRVLLPAAAGNKWFYFPKVEKAEQSGADVSLIST